MTSEERHEARYQRRRAKRLARDRRRAEEYTRWEDSFGFTPLIAGYKNVARASRKRATTQAWMGNLCANTRKIQKRLENGTWKSMGFNAFRLKERGKWRDILSVHISEKGIQNSFSNNCLIPILRPHLIYDNGASLTGKGTEFALKRFEKHLRDHVRKHGLRGGIYFFDFSGFFASVPTAPLVRRVSEKVMRRAFIALYEALVYAFGDVGLGLGSQVSQISAVFYPDPADHLVKDKYGIHGYGRYMDDGYIICDDLDRLKAVASAFEQKCESLGLKMNRKKCQIIKISKPFAFLKQRFRITATGKIVRKPARQTAKKERKRLHAFRRFYDAGLMPYRTVWLNFHSWIMSLHQKNNFRMQVGAIQYFHGLFPEHPPYSPNKIKTHKQKRVAFAARNAMTTRKEAA